MQTRTSPIDFYLKTDGKFVEFFFSNLDDAKKYQDILYNASPRCLDSAQKVDEQTLKNNLIYTVIQPGIHSVVMDRRGKESSQKPIQRRYVLRMHKDIFNSFCPGQEIPISNMVKDPVHSDCYQIIFKTYQEAFFYSEQLAAMNIAVLPNMHNAFIEYSKSDKTWLLRIDEAGRKKIDVAENYFSKLMPFEMLEQEEKSCHEVIEDFKLITGWDYFLNIAEQGKKLGSRELLKEILEDPLLSEYKRIVCLRNAIMHRKNKKAAEAKVIFRSPKIYSVISDTFFENASQYDFAEKIAAIREEIFQIKNPLFPYKFNLTLLAPVPHITPPTDSGWVSTSQQSSRYQDNTLFIVMPIPSAPPLEDQELPHMQHPANYPASQQPYPPYIAQDQQPLPNTFFNPGGAANHPFPNQATLLSKPAAIKKM